MYGCKCNGFTNQFFISVQLSRINRGDRSISKMSWSPSLIFYTCIAKGTTILAEFNSRDADLGDLARKCLEKTPPNHSVFYHTVHRRIYMFFILDPFVYFGIFNQLLEKHDCLSFLKSVQDSFTSMIDNCSSVTFKQRLNFPNSYCFQGEFSPVFHQILDSSLEFDTNTASSPARFKDDHSESLNSVRRKNKGSASLLRDKSSERLKMKKRFSGEANKDVLEEDKLDVLSDDDLTASSVCRLQRARYVWKKQVMVILFMDLIICAGLFVIWLWVCNGFQCVAN